MKTVNPDIEEMDREANIFAMCLLMPEEFVRQEVRKLTKGNRKCIDIQDGQSIKELANKFKVFETMMTLRIGQLYPI